jgi:hypothetical protein
VNRWRLVLAGLGLGVAAYGVVLLLDIGLDNLRATVVWLVAGVLVHDGFVAPITIAVVLLAVRLSRGRAAPPAFVAGAVVLATVTVVAVPVLGRFGERPDNPTLLDRNYVLGWLVLATLTVVLSGSAVLAGRTRARRGGGDGTRPGRR